jgi:hypothetical protein
VCGRDAVVDAEARAMAADAGFVAAWAGLRQRLVGVWIARSVHQAVRTDVISAVDAAVVLPSATQLWDRWFWRRWAHGADFSAAAGEIMGLTADHLHSRIMALLGLHVYGGEDGGGGGGKISDGAGALLSGAMCAWAAAVHMAGSWSGSWLSMEDLMQLRFRPAGALDPVYAALEGMVEAFGPTAYTPTVTGYLGARRASGVPTGRESRRVYDQYMGGQHPPGLPFWTWGPEARATAEMWSAG